MDAGGRTAPERVDPQRAEEIVREIREFRKGNRLDGLSIRELIDEGRK